MHWKKVTLVGVGLLGGSLGLALKRRRLAGRVVGYVRREASIKECLRARAVDQATLDLAAAVQDADLVIFCTPITQMAPLMREMLPALKPGAVVTDVGSVKRAVVTALEPLAAKARAFFVGSHPMAGSEKTGVAASKSDLFLDAVCVVTPTRKTDAGALRQVLALWKEIGCRVLELTPARHDLLVSRSSHLPHVLAAGLARFVLDPAFAPEQELLCATGFRDTTRIASGSPEMWRDILLTNGDYVRKALGSFVARLEEVGKAIDARDAAKLTRLFERAKAQRDAWANGKGALSPE